MWIRPRTMARMLGALLIGAGLAFALAMVFPHRRPRRDTGLPLPTPSPASSMAATVQ